MKQTTLMYHDVFVIDQQESGFHRERDLPYKVSVSDFEQQVKAIKEYCLQYGLPFDTVRFTFDDGGQSFFSVIAPILENYGFRGHFFISTGFIGAKAFLTSSEIVELEQRGHYIGSHAHSHNHLFKMSDEQVVYEWAESTSILKKILGKTITEASIPNGDLSNRVLDAMVKNGIKTIYTSEPTTKVSVYGDALVFGRYVIQGSDSMTRVLSIIKSHTTRLFYSFRRRIIKAVKYILGDYYIRLKYNSNE